MSMDMADLDCLGAQDRALAATRIYENGVPRFAEAALESLYECPMTTLLRFGQYYPMDAASTYVSWVDGVLHSVIVFAVEGRAIRVYNEQIAIPADELARFVQTLYRHYPEVQRISLYAVEGCTDGLAFPHQKLRCLEEISMPLPQTIAQYNALLSKNMAAKIRYYNKKLFSDFAGVSKHVAVSGEALDDVVRRIVGFNRMRMASKGQSCYHTDEETVKLIDLVKRYGLVSTIAIDGEVRAGAVMLRIGSTIALQTLAHHPDYNRYNLGTLCCYYGIAHAIQSGARHFNFGWGPYEYKYRLLGRHKDLHRIDIYRTTLALAGDTPTLCKRRLQARRRDFKLWMAHPGEDEGAVAGVLRRTLHAARSVRDRFH